MLGLDNRTLVNSLTCNVSPGMIRTVATRVTRIIRRNVRVTVIINTNGVFHNVGNSTSKVSQTATSCVNVVTAIVGTVALRSSLRHGKIPAQMRATVTVRRMTRPCVHHHTVHRLRGGQIIVFKTKSNGPFFAASAATTLHTTRVGTRIIFGTAGISNICSSSPGVGPRTGHCHALACNRILRRSLGIVSDATVTLYGSGGVPVVMFSLSIPNGVGQTLVNRPVNAVMKRTYSID